MRILTYYPNCSKGGVTSVLRGRATGNPECRIDAIFSNERGGRPSLESLDNVAVRIVRKDRVKTYLEYLTSKVDYDEIRVLSSPEVANCLAAIDSNAVSYEFHSSDWGVVENEIRQLDCDRLSRVIVPSMESYRAVSAMLPKRLIPRLSIEPNSVDVVSFNRNGDRSFLSRFADDGPFTPLVWVGRFDKGKGCDYVPRILAKLPERYQVFMVVSLETDPERAGRFLYECDAAGVGERVHVLMNLAPNDLGNLYRSASDMEGWFLSTSLMESFGYAVREAMECGLRVASFRLPVFEELIESELYHPIPVGDTSATARLIMQG